MSNYRTTTVRSVNKCQKTTSNPHTIPRKTTTNFLPFIHAHAGSSTGTARAAAVTVTNARPRRNSVIPAAAAPFRQGWRTSTAADTARAARNNHLSSGVCPASRRSLTCSNSSLMYWEEASNGSRCRNSAGIPGLEGIIPISFRVSCTGSTGTRCFHHPAGSYALRRSGTRSSRTVPSSGTLSGRSDRKGKNHFPDPDESSGPPG